MDDGTFDRMVRRIGAVASRRAALRDLAAAGIAAAAAGVGLDIQAKKRKCDYPGLFMSDSEAPFWCQRFLANQVRLLLHGAAYCLLDLLRRWLVAAGSARMQLATVRLRLITIGGRVRQLATRVHLRLAASHPGEPLWLQLAAREGRL